MNMHIGLYSKAIAGSVTAGMTAAITALTDGTITAYEWTVIAVAALGALGAVWAVPNVPETVRQYGKAGVAGLIATAGAVGTAVVDGSGISPAEWLGVGVALLGGLGLTYTVPNAEYSTALAPSYPGHARDDDGDGHPDIYPEGR